MKAADVKLIGVLGMGIMIKEKEMAETKYGNLSYSSDPKWKDHPLPPKPPESTLK